MGKHSRRSEIAVINPLFRPAIRKWLYGITSAAVPILVAYGILEEATAPLWLALFAQVFATGTAYLHTPNETAEV